MSSVRRFFLLLILRPDLIKQEDSEFFLSDNIDDKLVLAIIEMTNNEGEYNTAMIMHFLESRFDNELIKQIQTQITTFDDKMKIEEEIEEEIEKHFEQVFAKVQLEDRWQDSS